MRNYATIVQAHFLVCMRCDRVIVVSTKFVVGYCKFVFIPFMFFIATLCMHSSSNAVIRQLLSLFLGVFQINKDVITVNHKFSFICIVITIAFGGKASRFF